MFSLDSHTMDMHVPQKEGYYIHPCSSRILLMPVCCRLEQATSNFHLVPTPSTSFHGRFLIRVTGLQIYIYILSLLYNHENPSCQLFTLLPFSLTKSSMLSASLFTLYSFHGIFFYEHHSLWTLNSSNRAGLQSLLFCFCLYSIELDQILVHKRWWWESPKTRLIDLMRFG